MNSIVLILNLYLSVLLQGNINGVVVSVTGEQIPYASIGYYNHRVGTVSDAKGLFALRVIDNDSLKISAIGYEPLIISTAAAVGLDSFRLRPKENILEAVVIKNRPILGLKTTLGHEQRKSNFYSLSISEAQDAVFIPNPQGLTATIKSINFRMGDFQQSTFMLRVRLLDINQHDGMPGEDLLLYDNIVYPNKFRSHMTLNVQKHRLQTPADGLFVSFEFIPVSGQSVEGKKTPRLLGNTHAGGRFMYTNFKNIKWHRIESPLPSSGTYWVLNTSLTVEF